MTDPVRWRDGGDDAPNGARELLMHARPPSPMSAEAKARTAARVVAIAATPIATALLGKWLSGKSLAFLAGFGLIGAAVGVGVYAAGVSAERSAPPSLASARLIDPSRPTVASVALSSSVPVEERQVSFDPPDPRPLPEVLAQSTRPRAPRPSVAASASGSAVSASDALAREAGMLERARAEIASDPAGALVELDRHAREFPDGQLGAERELLAIDALRRLGRTDEARARGEAFIARRPKSLYVDRVRKMIGADK